MMFVRLSIFICKIKIYTTKNTKWNTVGITDESAENFFQQSSDLGAYLVRGGLTN